MMAPRLLQSSSGGAVLPMRQQCLGRTGSTIMLLAAALALVSCISPNRPITAKLQRPVIFVPGMPGSVLKDANNDEVLWGKVRFGPNHTREEAARLVLPLMVDGKMPGNGGVVPGGVLERFEIRILGRDRQWEIYAPLLRQMTKMEPDPDRGKFVHSFAYDWRLDCAENARRLHRFMDRTAAQLRREFPERFGQGREVQFDIVAHSMGALLARYALCYGDTPLETAVQRRDSKWSSANRCRKFIMVNPSNGGSMYAHGRLMRGYSYGPMLPQWSPAMLGTLPSLYQLLPADPQSVEVREGKESRAVPLLDVRVWQKYRWGLFAPEAETDLQWLAPGMPTTERNALVLRHVSTCLDRAADFRSAMEGTSQVPSGIEFNLLMGTTFRTPHRSRFDASSRKVKTIERKPGDYMVTLRSALDVPGLRLPPEESGEAPAGWHSVHLDGRDHVTAIASRSWIERIAHLLVEGEAASFHRRSR